MQAAVEAGADPVEVEGAQVGLVHLRRAIAHLDNLRHELSLAEACSDRCAIANQDGLIAGIASALRRRAGAVERALFEPQALAADAPRGDDAAALGLSQFGAKRPWYRRWRSEEPTPFHRVLALHLRDSRWQRSALDE